MDPHCDGCGIRPAHRVAVPLDGGGEHDVFLCGTCCLDTLRELLPGLDDAVRRRWLDALLDGDPASKA